MKCNILFTCAGRRNYLINYFKEALNGNGKVVAVDRQLTAPALVDADLAIKVPDIYSAKYIPTLIKTIKEENIHAVISLNDLELPILSENKKRLEKTGVRVLISGKNVIDIAFDKWKTFQFLKSQGINTPKTYLTLEDAREALKKGDLQFPLVLKPRWGSASISIDFPENDEELALSYKLQSLKIQKSILSKASSEDIEKAIVIQEKLTGKEFGMDILNDFDRNYYGTFLREKLAMRSGETDKAMSVRDPQLENIGKKIAGSLKHVGNMDCDAFLHNGDLYMLELNPRFGGGYPFSHEAGVNIAAIYLEWLKGNKNVDAFNQYQPDIIFSKCDRLLKISDPKDDSWNLEVKEIENEKDFKTYKKLLKAIDCDNPFYKIRITSSLEQGSGERSCYFVFHKNKTPMIVMPFYFRDICVNNEKMPYYDVCSPYGYSGPSFSPDMPKEYLSRFWKAVDTWYKEHNVVSEFVRFSLNGNHTNYTGTLVHTLNNVMGIIREDNEQWENLKPKGRNNYRRALQEQLACRIYYKDIPEEIVKTFYEIYISTMKRNNADERYFYELEYFKTVITQNPKICAIAVIYKDEIPISSEFILLSNNTVYSFLGGTDANYFNSRPNDFLKLEVLKWGRKQGKQYYSLGGGREDNDGLYKYKKSFFPKDPDVVYYTGRKIVNKKVYKELLLKKNVNDIQVITKTIEANYFPFYRTS